MNHTPHLRVTRRSLTLTLGMTLWALILLTPLAIAAARP